ncbi:TIGR01777 family oxidoreductase [Archangium sp.]|uniref:TIGR01777 family oxidoreductase n=1 Tax=Archangium sp. TaxID=1872627 RepID=UPI003BB89BD7
MGLLEAARVVAVTNLESFDFFPARGIALSHVRGEEKKRGIPILVDLKGTLGNAPWKLPRKTSSFQTLGTLLGRDIPQESNPCRWPSPERADSLAPRSSSDCWRRATACTCWRGTWGARWGGCRGGGVAPSSTRPRRCRRTHWEERRRWCTWRASRWPSGGRSARQRIRDSRVVGTRLLVEAMRAAGTVRHFVSASAIGYYGAGRGAEPLTESSSPGEDFLARVCQAWDAEALKAAAAGIRTVVPRIGVVLHPEGGALKQLLPVFRLGVGGRMGSGQQYMSWVHRDDTLGLLLFALEQPELRGPMNVTAPEPVTNADFSRTLGAALGRPAVLPVPSFALKAALGEDVRGGAGRPAGAAPARARGRLSLPIPRTAGSPSGARGVRTRLHASSRTMGSRRMERR